jgi:AbiV family abortive infection protein
LSKEEENLRAARLKREHGARLHRLADEVEHAGAAVAGVAADSIPLSPSLEAILQNAARLLDDARLLYDNQRFASATALAILAIEEMGKYFIVKMPTQKGSAAGDLNKHIEKQVSFGSFPFVETAIMDFLPQMKEIGFIIEPDAEITEEQRQWMNSEAGWACVRERLRSDGFWDNLAQRVLDSEDGSFMARARNKEFDKLKQRCIYVDLNESSEVLAGPADITQETANYFVRLAHRVISRYASPALAVEGPGARRALGEGDDLPG